MTVILNCKQKTCIAVDQFKTNKDLLTDLNQEIDSYLDILDQS